MIGDWVEWDGKDACPVSDGTLTNVRFRNGDEDGGDLPTGWRWDHEGVDWDIVAYQVEAQPSEPSEQSERESVPEATPTKHSHYHKDVSHLSSIDVYRVLHLFGVTDQAIGHAAKKLLCAGQRGHKDLAKDIQDSIDTLVRWQEMRKEDDVL